MSDSDHELMQRSRCGDTAAFEALVRRWERPVARIIARLAGTVELPNLPEIEDLSQEVFLRVLSARDRYHNHCAFSTWLYRIVLNVVRDAARRRQRWWKFLNNHRPAPQTATPPDESARAEMEGHVNAALSCLPVKLREPVVLRHYGELTFDEVAQVLGEPVSTVKSRVRRGLLEMQQELRRRGIDEQEIGS